MHLIERSQELRLINLFLASAKDFDPALGGPLAPGSAYSTSLTSSRVRGSRTCWLTSGAEVVQGRASGVGDDTRGWGPKDAAVRRRSR
jgi:hypothetical protein